VKWQPARRMGLLVGGAIILAVMLVDAVLLWRVTHGALNGWTFVSGWMAFMSLPAIAAIVYRMANLARLRYEFDRNQFVISTAATRQIVPMERIDRVIDGQHSDLEVRTRSLRWPGCYLGQGEIKGLGWTLFYAVSPPKRQVILVTPNLVYGITPPDMDAFHQVFQASKQLGPSAEVEHVSVRSPWTCWAIWSDRLAQGILVTGLVLCALLFALLCFRYPSLPNLLSMHYDVSGRVDRIAPRGEVFTLPVISAMIWAVNGVLGGLFYRHQRLLSYLAWSGAAIVQVLFLSALWSIVT
jgi:hypothetical protein